MKGHAYDAACSCDKCLMETEDREEELYLRGTLHMLDRVVTRLREQATMHEKNGNLAIASALSVEADAIKEWRR